MTFSFFTKNAKRESLALLIDIGSASVGAALMEVGPDKIPHVVATTREDIPFQDELSSARFLSAMSHALERALKTIQLKTKATGVPANIFCSLSSPWFLLKSRHLLVERKEAFEVNADFLEKLLDEEIDHLKAELKETLPPEDMMVIEKKIIQTKLNGYDIKNPYGQQATHLKLTMTVGISSRKVIQRIERTLQNFFHVVPIHFGAFPIAAFSAIRDIYPTEKTFIFLDITGESTDVTLVNNDLLMGTMTFPRGKNYFVRAISSQFAAPHEAAMSTLNMFLDGKLDAIMQQQVELLLSRLESEWVTRFQKTLTLFEADGPLSHKIFFMADADASSLFATCIGKATREVDASKKIFDVQYIDQIILEKFVNFASEVNRDVFLATEALLATKVVPQLKNNS